MQIIKNFLSEQNFSELKNIILSDEFPWYFNENSLNSSDSSLPQFTHNFLKNYRTSNYFFCIEKILQKIEHSVLFRIKANLTTKTNNIIKKGFHKDIDKKGFKSAIFFINSCDGFCQIEDKKIFSEENKLLVFDSNIEHTGTSCTDKNRRIVINFVYAL